MSRYTVFIIICSIFIGVSGLAIELEIVRPLGFSLTVLGYSLVLSSRQFILLCLLEIILGAYFVILLHQEEQQELIIVGQT